MTPVLKAVNSDMSAKASWRNPFYYPALGPVQDRDGEGLHGLPWGIGNLNWFGGFVSPKYIVLVADSVTLLTGKCRFGRGEVVGVHDYLDEAACQIASLTLFWTTPQAAAYLRNTSEDEHGVVTLAFDVKQEMERRYNLLAEGVAMREQAIRARAPQPASTGILVSNWPMPQPVPKPQIVRPRG